MRLSNIREAEADLRFCMGMDHSTKYNYENKNYALFHTTSSVRHATDQL